MAPWSLAADAAALPPTAASAPAALGDVVALPVSVLATLLGLPGATAERATPSILRDADLGLGTKQQQQQRCSACQVRKGQLASLYPCLPIQSKPCARR